MALELYRRKQQEIQDALDAEQSFKLLRNFQTIGYSGTGAQVSGVFRIANALVGFTNEGSGIVQHSDDGILGTRLTALKKCKFEVTFTTGGPTTLRAFSIRKNGNLLSSEVADIAIGGDVGSATVTLALNINEYVDFYSSQSGFGVNTKFVMYAEEIKE